MISALSGKEPY